MKTEIGLLLALLGVAGCDYNDDRQVCPRLQVTHTSTVATAAAEPEAACVGTCTLGTVQDHEGVTVILDLPERVDTDEMLEIVAETPCTSVTTHTAFGDVKDGDRSYLRAETTVEAPAGASCRLTVTVRVANYEQVCRSPVGECTNLEALCGDADATGTSGSGDSNGSSDSGASSSDGTSSSDGASSSG